MSACEDNYQQQAEARVKTDEQWHSEHDAHGPATRQPLEHAPYPEYPVEVLVCPCGAKHARMLYKCGYCGLPKGRSDAD